MYLPKTSLASEILPLIFDIVREAGSIALDLQPTIDTAWKADRSPVTEGDLAISRLAQKAFSAPIFTDNGIVCLDEESFDADPSSFSLETLSTSSVIAVDPIGGTISYMSGLPFFGTYIGILRGGEPWLGVVYLPALRELFYTDGDSSYLIINPFSSSKTKTKILPSPHHGGNRVVFSHLSNVVTPPVMNPYGMGVGLTWPLLGRGDGAVFQAKLWDFVAQWAIARRAGFKFYRVKDWRLLEALSLEDFNPDLTLKSPWAMIHPETLESFKGRIIAEE